MCVCAGNKRDKMPWASRGFYESLLIFSQNGVYTAAVRARIQMDLGDLVLMRERKGLSGFFGISNLSRMERKTALEGYPEGEEWMLGNGIRQIIVDLCFAFHCLFVCVFGQVYLHWSGCCLADMLRNLSPVVTFLADQC